MRGFQVSEARHRTGATSWRIRPRALTALAVASAGLVASIWLPGLGDTAEASVARPVFADDFGASRGTGLDLGKWLLDGEQQSGLQDGDGRLVVNRLISTRKAFAEPFGHAEARIKVRRAPGVWRAFGVVDKYGRVLRGDVKVLDKDADPTSGNDFHTYAIDWSPTEVLWSVDGAPSLRLVPKEQGLPIALVLNLATDGRRPARMIVDFVHVVAGAKPPAPGVTPPSSSGSPNSPSSPATSAPTTAPTTAPPTSAPASKPPASKPPAPKPTPKPAAWKAYTDYSAGDLVSYKGVTYRVKEDHTSLPGWEPTALPNLFAKV
jgi:hypothetical protein